MYMVCNCRALQVCLKCWINMHRLVSALKAGNLKILKDKTQSSSYTIKSGFVEVLHNKTTVLVEGAEEV